MALAGVLGLASCSSDSADDAGPPSSELVDSAPTTPTVPPHILALTGNLDLTEGQCYEDLPPPSEIEPDATTTVVGQETVETEPTVPPTLAPTTTTPRPSVVAVVDCAGPNRGTVYATFCLGPHPEFADDLTAAPCPGGLEVEYPGDRSIRRAASRICLQRFSERYGEDYATSTRTATEFVPTEGLWKLDDRRVICLASEPQPATDE